MTSIIAGIVALLIVAGGVIPNITNSKIEDSIKKAFNNPQKTEVKVYSTPSYKVLSGNFDRIEIEVQKPKLNNIEFETIKMITSPIDIDYKKLSEESAVKAIKKGELEALLVVTPENIAKAINFNDLTNKANNFLSNFELPIPMLSGQVSIDTLNITFKNNKPTVYGNFIALGGFITAPFTISGDLVLTNKNTLELSKPQVTLYEEELLPEQVGDLVKFINPVIDFNKVGDNNIKINLKKLDFKDNKLRMTGLINLKN